MTPSNRFEVNAGTSRRRWFDPLGPLFGTICAAALSTAAANLGLKALSVATVPRLIAGAVMVLYWVNFYLTTVAGRIVIGDGQLVLECLHRTTVFDLAAIETVALRCLPHTMSGGYQSIRVKQRTSLLPRTFRYDGATLQTQKVLADALIGHGVNVRIKNPALW